MPVYRFRLIGTTPSFIRLLTVLFGSILLSACATGAQRQGAQMEELAAETLSASRDCQEGIYAKPEYDHLKTKMFLSSSPIFPLQYLTDSTRPTKKEIADLYKLHADIQACRKILLEGAGRVHPAYVTILVGTYSAADKLWIEAASGRMTWGNFNQQRQSIATQTVQQINETRSMIVAQLQNQNQFELAQRQRAIESMQHWALQQQALENQRIAAMAAGHAAATAGMSRSVLTCNYVAAGTMTCQ